MFERSASAPRLGLTLRAASVACAALCAVVIGAAPSAWATQEPAPPPHDCATLEAYQQAWIAAIPGDTHGLERTFACYPDGAGAFWGFSIGSVLFTDPTGDDPEGGVTGSYQLVRFVDGAIQYVATYPLTWQRYDKTARSLAVSDFDRDGSVELVWTTRNDGAEAEPDQRVEVVDYVDGALQPYAPAAAVTAFEARDIDGDGVLDLLTAGEFEATWLCGLYEWPLNGPYVPYLSLPDGTFTADHPAARAYVAGRCEDVPPVSWVSTWDEALVMSIACARHAGVDAETLRQELATVAEAHADQCLDRAALEALVASEPSLRIAPSPGNHR